MWDSGRGIAMTTDSGIYEVFIDDGINFLNCTSPSARKHHHIMMHQSYSDQKLIFMTTNHYVHVRRTRL